MRLMRGVRASRKIILVLFMFRAAKFMGNDLCGALDLAEGCQITNIE